MGSAAQSFWSGVIRRVFASAASYEVLPEGTWQAGGCWTAAHAIQAFMGGTLVAVLSTRNGLQVEHVAVELPGCVVADADGIRSPKQLLRVMREREAVPRPFLARFSHELRRRAKLAGLDWDQAASRRVQALLRAEAAKTFAAERGQP